MQQLLTKVWNYEGLDYTQEKLATDLGRPTKSVRSSMNGPLAKAIKGVEARGVVNVGPQPVDVARSGRLL